MSLKPGQTRSYKWPVEWTVPIDGGRHEKQEIEVEFKRLGQGRLDEIVAAATKGTGEISDKDLVNEVMVGWSTNVRDDNDQPLPFSPSNMAQVLDRQGVRAAIVRAFFNSLIGAKEKN